MEDGEQQLSGKRDSEDKACKQTLTTLDLTREQAWPATVAAAAAVDFPDFEMSVTKVISNTNCLVLATYHGTVSVVAPFYSHSSVTW